MENEVVTKKVMGKGPLISLIICTRNRGTALNHCLNALSEMEVPCEWELVLVNNGSTDNTADIIKKFIHSSPLINVRFVYESIPGLARARNSGIRYSSGEIIVFTDDDCYPEPDYLLHVAQVFNSPEISYFGGRVVLYDPKDYMITVQYKNEVQLIRPNTFIPAGLIHGANMGFRKKIFKRIGGFNELLGAGTLLPSEDVEFIARASASGFTGGYFPGPVVKHHHGRRSKEQIQSLVRSYHLGRGAYYASMLLNKKSRYLYLKHWWWSISKLDWERNIYELKGALIYFRLYTINRLKHKEIIPAFK